MEPLFGAAYAAPIKAPQFYINLGPQKKLQNPPVNGNIQGLFKAFEYFSSTFKVNFIFKTVGTLCKTYH